MTKHSQGAVENPRRMLFLYTTLSALMACSAISTDLYLPGLPSIESQMGGNIELTITGFLIGFAIAQLIWGPVSDRIGRKIPLMLGMAIFAVGSAGCALASTTTELVLWRLVQAVGACVGPMLARAIVRDMYQGVRAAQVLSTLVLIMAIAPIAGPLLGGFLVVSGGWRLTFWAIVTISAIILLLVFFLPESLPENKRESSTVLAAFRSYPLLLRRRTFMRYVLCVCFFYVAIYAFITASSSVYITRFGVDPRYYGLLFGVNIIGVMVLSSFNRRFVQRYSLDFLLRISTAVAGSASILAVITVAADVGGLWGVAVPVFLVFSMNGIVAACTNAAALNSVEPAIAGSAAALLGSFQYGSGIISSLLLAVIPGERTILMVSIICAFVLLSAVMGFPKAPEEKPKEQPQRQEAA